jgi:uncharacterized protein YecE (DUF72 family)
MAKKEIRIGTSGWVYDDWKGRFYPEDLPQDKWFEFYAERFDTVEINNTFYNLPDKSTFRKWEKQASIGFLYAPKANRYITHMKKLNNPEDAVKNFIERVRLLDDKLGPVLWQLPPNWHKNVERLKGFIKLLPDDLRHAFEFRDPTWFDDDVLEVLDDAGCAFVVHDMTDDVPRWTSGDFVYIRFHGTQGKYSGGYGKKGLKTWAEWLGEQYNAGKSIYGYFNNDIEGHAIDDAKTLREMLTS